MRLPTPGALRGYWLKAAFFHGRSGVVEQRREAGAFQPVGERQAAQLATASG